MYSIQTLIKKSNLTVRANRTEKTNLLRDRVRGDLGVAPVKTNKNAANMKIKYTTRINARSCERCIFAIRLRTVQSRFFCSTLADPYHWEYDVCLVAAHTKANVESVLVKGRYLQRASVFLRRALSHAASRRSLFEPSHKG